MVQNTCNIVCVFCSSNNIFLKFISGSAEDILICCCFQGPSASAYVTYCVNNDALRAIQSVNNIMIDGRLIKTSLGTTKYCSHFMKNQQCPKPDCMYLHELGDSEASFTKEVLIHIFYLLFFIITCFY